MQEKLLKEILSEVKIISEKVDNLEGKVDNLERKVDNLEGRVDIIEKTMVTTTEFNNFKEEVYLLFEKNTKEIANEIRELSVSISKKVHEEQQAIKKECQRELEINQKDHEIFEAQIEKVQITTHYLESKIHI